MNLTTEQSLFLATAGLIYATLLDAPDATDLDRIEGWQRIEAIIRQARLAGFSDTLIAQAMGLPSFLVIGVES